MADYYLSHFTIDGDVSEGLELLDKVESVVRDWAQNHRHGQPLDDKKTGAWHHPNGGSHIRIESGRLEYKQAGYWSLSFEHPDDKTDAIRWQTEFQLATKGNGVEIGTIVQVIGDMPESMERSVSRPNALVALSERFQCQVGEEQITTSATRIIKDNARTFVNEDVFNPDRRLPLIMVAENRFGGMFMSANYLQSRLLGLARVTTYDYKTAAAINRELGDSLGCWDGTIRVYRPGCSADDPSWRNRYWIWTRMNSILRSSGWDQILQEVEEECVSRSIPQIGHRLYDEVRDSVRQYRYERVTEQLRKYQKSDEDSTVDTTMLNDLIDTLADYERQRTEKDLQIQRQIAGYERQIADLRTENLELHDKVDQLNLALSYQDTTIAETEDFEDLPPEFDSIYQVVEFSSEKFDRIRFFPRAEQLAKASDFPRPKDLYMALEALNECAEERLDAGLGKDVQQWLRERGVDYSPHESDATMGKYGDKRVFFDQENKRRVEMQPHLKLGGGLGERNQLRMHVSWDDDEEKWLVGYIGRHLDTVTG